MRWESMKSLQKRRQKNQKRNWQGTSPKLELKRAAGDNEVLKQQIAELQVQNQQKDADYQKQLKKLQMTNAIKFAIANSAQDSDLVAGLIDKTKLLLGDDGKVTGLDDQLKVLKESKSFLLKSRSQRTRNHSQDFVSV